MGGYDEDETAYDRAIQNMEDVRAINKRQPIEQDNSECSGCAKLRANHIELSKMVRKLIILTKETFDSRCPTEAPQKISCEESA